MKRGALEGLICVLLLLFTCPLLASTLLAPGDRLAIVQPGEPAFDQPFQINKQGEIALPEVGNVVVGGKTLQQADELIRTSLKPVYNNLSQLTVTLLEKRLLISVMGYVKKPGSYDLAPDGNVQMALDAAGGLVPGAQLNNMQVRRGSTVSSFDYKRYLDTGDASVLPPLQSLDVVFVPASPLIGNVQIDFDAATLAAGGDGDTGKAIKVFGEVNSPGAFSFKSGNSIVDLLMRAGGVTRFAGVERIRVINGDAPELFDLKAYLDSGNNKLLPNLAPGATIFVPKDEEQIKRGARTIYIMGEVFKPGAYEGREGDSFLDILANAGGPTRYAESRQIRLLRTDGTIEPIDLQAYTEGMQKALPQVKPGDAIFVPEKTDINEKSWLKVAPGRAVMVMGAVRIPGRYEWSDEMSLLDLIAHAGGPNERADIAKVQILTAEGGQATPTLFDLDKFLHQGGALASLPKIRAGFTIMIPELPTDPSDNKSQWVRQSPDSSIYIFGQVGAPGRYAFNEQMGFIDILSAADGPTAAADLRNVRIAHRSGSTARVSKLDLALYFETGDETLLPKVLPGDSIYLPEKNRPWLDEPKENTIRVLGAIARPGRYRFDSSMTLLDLLAEAGGPTSSAYIKKIVVINMATSGQGDQARSFDLDGFAKEPDFSQLPVLRAGDTVFIPDSKSSNWAIFMDGMRDILTTISVVALVGTL
ncbi:sugar ABC transporter substrate-binding protein [Aeromonas veronii]|uniref:SLBB domain-containing protein n=1 Tax=Aeromonas veronii TaxID=654 RepID=UPI001431480B|nr:SLBB domain-containing protein [Aeromonas veronii]NJI21578.1 sugar ABC transporter substrate-binding protein [Aeromonas veronii]NJI35089.1 sugar ABC transporter substrate-binding protein [Aeromonas veronii]